MMSNIFLYNTPILPDGFVFPQSYIDTVKSNNIIDLEPWDFLCKDIGKSLSYYGALLIEYRDQPLIPFAIASDESGFFNDGYVVLACFDGSDKSGDPKVYFHDYGYSYSGEDPVRGKQYYLENFSVWLESAKEESAQYKADTTEPE